MVRIAFVNIGMGSLGPTIRRVYEPAHLLGMHAICEQAGHKSTIIQYGIPTPTLSIERVREFRPDILGISFIVASEADIKVTHDLLHAFQGSKPKLILGGTGIQYLEKDYVEQFSPYYKAISAGTPFFIVIGAGELVMRALAISEFNPLSIGERDASNYGIQLQTVEKIPVVYSRYLLPLDQHSFVRPYDLSPYGGIAGVRWENGCKAACSFCGNTPREIGYRTPPSILEEIAYLRKFGVAEIEINAANFTAHPGKASTIFASLPRENLLYSFDSRVDNLYYAIRRHANAWRGFKGAIQLGVESFAPQRLGPGRLRKYPSMKGARLQEERLKYVCDFFKNEDVQLIFYMIMFDREMSPGEVEFEVRKIISFYKRYPKVIVSLWDVGNILGYEPGSPLSFKMGQDDFFNYERDPRVLLLATLMKVKTLNILKVIDNYDRVASREMLNYLLSCLKRVKEISPDRFNMRSIMKKIQDSGLSEDVLEEFYSQLGKEGLELKKYFDRNFPLFLAANSAR